MWKGEKLTELLFREKKNVLVLPVVWGLEHIIDLFYVVFCFLHLSSDVAVIMVIVTMQGMLKESESPEPIQSLFLGLLMISTLQRRRCRNDVTTVDTSTFEVTGSLFLLVQTRWMKIYYFCKR